LDPIRFQLGKLLRLDAFARDLIPATIYRLAESRKAWRQGSRQIAVQFRPELKPLASERLVIVEWSYESIGVHYGYDAVREDLRKLANAKNSEQITEGAAIGTAFVLVTVLMPNDTISKVVQKGGRGDFYLNGRADEMIEISGTLQGPLDSLFNKKRTQVLLNEQLTRAIVSVTGFERPRSRLERVK